MNEIDVVLNGDRNYVQGTQIIARSAQMYSKAERFSQATFSQITDKRIAVSENNSDLAIANVVFTDRAGLELPIYVHQLDEVAPQAIVPRQFTFTRTIYDASGASYQFEDVVDFEGFINVITASIKLEHKHRFNRPVDIWLTGMRGWDIPLRKAEFDRGELKLTLGRSLAGDGAIQTMWRVEANSISGNMHSGMVTFCYREANYAD